MGQTDGETTDFMGMNAIEGHLSLAGAALSDVTRKSRRIRLCVPALKSFAKDAKRGLFGSDTRSNKSLRKVQVT